VPLFVFLLVLGVDFVFFADGLINPPVHLLTVLEIVFVIFFKLSVKLFFLVFAIFIIEYWKYIIICDYYYILLVVFLSSFLLGGVYSLYLL